MPKDPNIHRVLIIGSGPIVIGQACEFDYSGTQACRALAAEGISVVLLNSNPATIMTDPELADRTYLEPITPEVIGRILERERDAGTPIDSMLPTLGGQTGLNCAVESAKRGLLDRFGVRMIGANSETIHRAENRRAFKETVAAAGVCLPRSDVAHTLAEAGAVLERVGLPCCVRPAYTLGGHGGGMAHTEEAFEQLARRGLDASRIDEVLIEEDLTGWKEYELEMMRDRNDNVVVVCSIENLDPMGVHTGDSITVAPALTLTDVEYQRMRDAGIAIIRAVGVETGGANIQFAVDPADGRLVAIEMNPRVSRSSALASKATGFPIAKIASLLAIGYTLDEIRNEITRETPACFEPTIDYCVVKMPRFAFEKFPDADETLTTQMKSVGEAMAIGRTFKEAFQKCIRSMEIKRSGFGLDDNDLWLKWFHRRERDEDGGGFVWVDRPAALGESPIAVGGTRLGEAPADWREESATEWPVSDAVLVDKLATPCQGRPYYVRYALKRGWGVERICELTGMDPWLIDQLQQLVRFEDELVAYDFAAREPQLDRAFADTFRQAKALGYSDDQLMHAWRASPQAFERVKKQFARSSYKLVDTCAAEFESYTPYFYSTHEAPVSWVVRDTEAAAETARTPGAVAGDGSALQRAVSGIGVRPPYGYRRLDRDHIEVTAHEDELRPSDRPKVVILGGGPNRIGQGIEFDYCCVHAVQAAREMGYETVMINSNPETVSTDYDTSDLLFFEPLTHEHVYDICRRLAGDGGGTEGAGGAGLLRGVVVQFGGQTPLNLAQRLADDGVPILGTSPQNIHLAEDRERFGQVINELGLVQPPGEMARSRTEALSIAGKLGYPVLVRPSYVLGGRAMCVCNNADDLERYVREAGRATERQSVDGRPQPILVDKFLLDAIEVDVDAVSDYGCGGRDPAAGRCDICGIMEHIEEAGIHSGDSCCTLPAYSLSPAIEDEIKYQVKLLARRLNVCGLLNVQFAIRERTLFVIEVNPRASRTVPFASKATGAPWAKIAMKVMLGQTLDEALRDEGRRDVPPPQHVAVKVPVFPFNKFPGSDAVLGPEMHSTGEVMGIDASYPLAYAKAMLAAGIELPTRGTVLVSVNDPDKPRVVNIARELVELGFDIVSTVGTHQVLQAAGVRSATVSKHADDEYPFLLDLIRRRKLCMLINTPIHQGGASEEARWRSASVTVGIPLITTLAGARAAVGAIRALRAGDWSVRSLQEYHRRA